MAKGIVFKSGYPCIKNYTWPNSKYKKLFLKKKNALITSTKRKARSYMDKLNISTSTVAKLLDSYKK